MYTIVTRSADETFRLGELLGTKLQTGDMIALNGDLGAGKTCLTRGVGKGLGITGRVKSPSFALINEYDGKVPLYHMDVYRLESPAEMEDLGYEEYFYGAGATIVEWADKVKECLPGQRLEILINKTPDNENERKIKLLPHGSRYEQLARELTANVRTGY